MLSEDEIVKPQQRDEVLKILYDHLWPLYTGMTDDEIIVKLKEKGIACNKKQIFTILCTLELEGFAKGLPQHDTKVIFWHIDFKGLGFINTDTFVERAKKEKIENGMKRFSYNLRWVTFLFSLIAVTLSLYTLFKPTEEKHTQIYLMPQGTKEIKVTDTVRHLDSSTKGN